MQNLIKKRFILEFKFCQITCYGFRMDRNFGKGHRKNDRPPGLSGKEIGMYYKNLAMKRKLESGGVENKRILLGPSVVIPPKMLENVEDLLARVDHKGDEKVCDEFEMRFRHVLSVNFEEFIKESKQAQEDVDTNNISTLNKRFLSDMLAKEALEDFRNRYKERLKLPAMKYCDQIVKAVKKNQVTLIVGSTGCGKTTQVPQILLDDYIYSNRGAECRIVCTQPRRISAITVAERVASERCERLGSSVGYQIRLESTMPREHGSVLYCTTGILLQKMQSDPLLRDLAYVILDEIHERSVETDLLMGLLKKILPHRLDLKVVLMSATVSEKDFCAYFDNCYTLHIEGTLFPVDIVYLEDILQETGFTRFINTPQQSNHRGKHKQKNRNRGTASKNFEYEMLIEPYLRQLRDKYDPAIIQALRCPTSEGCENIQFLEFLIFYICASKPPGAILVFLPGYDKISKLHTALQNSTLPDGKRFASKIQVYPLHSLMPTVNQANVFKPSPPGIRKIILSTIIAETSVTIEDVVYVINTGRTKISNYDADANIQTLEEVWVTRANTKQRMGRAGRVQPGICYNLFTKARERVMDDIPTPEILRSKLESIILNLKLLHIKDESEFLETLINKPNPVAIRNGIHLLKRINALDKDGILTPLGMHLARLPIDPQMGKMCLMAALFRCIDPITSVAAGLSYRSPFQTPLGKEQSVDRVKRDLAANTRSDHLLLDNVIIDFRYALKDGLERDYCYKNFLSLSTLHQLIDMKKQFTELLRSASFIESSRCTDKVCNVNSNNLPLLRAIIAAGLYPNMAHLRKARQIKNRVHAIHSMSTPEEKRVNFHPSSVNCGVPSFDSHYFVYFQKQKSSALYLLDATMVFPMALLIFGDNVETGVTPDNERYISVANSFFFKCDRASANVIIQLRQRMEWLLQKKALYPSTIEPYTCEDYLITAIQMLLSLDEVVEYEDQFLSDDDDDTIV